MNKIYRKVWNRARGQWIVASELASGDSCAAVGTGRLSGSPLHIEHYTLAGRWRPGVPLTLLVSAAALAFPTCVWAGYGGNDNGTSFVNGNGSLIGSSGGGGVQYSDMGVAFVGDGDCSALTSGPGTYSGVYGTGGTFLGGLFGFGAQTTSVSWGTANNAGSNAGIIPFLGTAQTFGNVVYAANTTQSAIATQAFGMNSFAVGCGSHAYGLGSSAIGYGATATGVGSVAMGVYSSASGQSGFERDDWQYDILVRGRKSRERRECGRRWRRTADRQCGRWANFGKQHRCRQRLPTLCNGRGHRQSLDFDFHHGEFALDGRQFAVYLGFDGGQFALYWLEYDQQCSG